VSVTIRRHRRLFRYAAPHARGWATIVVVTVLSTLFSLLQPWPLQVLIDHVLGSAPMAPPAAAIAAWLPGGQTARGLLLWVVLSGVAIYAVNSLADFILTLQWTRVGRCMVYHLARDLFASIQRRSLTFHSHHPVGDSLSRITGDAWCVHTVVDTLLFAPGHAVLTTAAMLVVMVRLDPTLTVYALGVAPLMAAAAWLSGRPIRAAAHARRDAESRMQSHVQQTLSGVPVVQSFTREDDEQSRFHEYACEAIRAHQRTAFVGSMYGLASGLVTTVGTGAILWLASVRVINGTLSIGTTLVFLSYLRSLQTQLAAVAAIYTAVQGAGASVDRVMAVLEADDAVREVPGARALERVRGDVSIAHVAFGYVDGQEVLRDVTLSATAGETIAIVGPTGAGKSTLASLIPRLVDPIRGTVSIDGHDLRSLQIDSVRHAVSVVLQEPFLFPVSIAENIALGSPGASPAAIEAAARAANAHAFISRLPEGYDTLIGERGATLSGGERQRIAIARAILKDAPILVLDEPTSALDAETERSLMDALERLMRGRTTFVIAHRLSTIRNAARIVVMDRGAIVEEGTQAELLTRGGRYSQLYELQSGAAAGAPAA
jgi:ATP-binding cassette subfamily B protein/subfamily B ATP-binding cassette protein MsbA